MDQVIELDYDNIKEAASQDAASFTIFRNALC